MSTTAVCPVCERPQEQGLLDDYCTTALERELGDVAAIVGELDVTLSKQDRLGGASSGGNKPKGWDREKVPMNVGAMQAADNLGNVLTTWARDVGTGPTEGRWIRYDATRIAAAMLLSHIPEIRRHPAVAELVDEITDAITQARRAVDRPADRTYLGQCLVPTPDEEGREVTCLAELWARPQASEVRCKVCGAEHPVSERRAWLMLKAKDMIVTVKEASSYLGEIGGIKVTESSIRGYLHRGARLQYRAPVEAKRFRLGDLLDVVMDESERKSA